MLIASERALKARLNRGFASIPHNVRHTRRRVCAEELEVFFLECAAADKSRFQRWLRCVRRRWCVAPGSYESRVVGAKSIQSVAPDRLSSAGQAFGGKRGFHPFLAIGLHSLVAGDLSALPPFGNFFWHLLCSKGCPSRPGTLQGESVPGSILIS